MALCSSVLAANSVAQLTDSLRHGFVAQDAKAIARLVYWGEAPDELKASFERRVTRFFGRRWLSVDMASIPDDLQARYERQGIQWELTLMPLLQIKVVLESLGNTESLDFLIGQKSGQFYLISAQPEKKAQPDVQP